MTTNPVAVMCGVTSTERLDRPSPVLPDSFLVPREVWSPPPLPSLARERALSVEEILRLVVQALDDPPRDRGLLAFRARTATRCVRR